MNEPVARRTLSRSARVAEAFVLGVAAALIAKERGMPGDGTFVAVAFVAVLVAALVAGAGRIGLVAVVGGCLIVVQWLSLQPEATGGLWWLISTILAALLAHGYAVGWIVQRVHRLGVGSRLVSDGPLIAVTAMVVLLPLIYIAVAADFGRNPP